MRFTSRVAPLARVALLALAAFVCSTTLPSVVAQGTVMNYVLAETWTSVEPRYAVTPLPWPEFHRPGGIGLDRRDGRLFVTDRTASLILEYDPAGRFVRPLGGEGAGPGWLRYPRDVAVLPDGRLAVSDSGNDRVQILEPDGTFVRAWPVPDPQGIAFVADPDVGGIYVVSRADDRIYGFDEQGGLIETFVLPTGSGTQELAFVEAPSVDDGGQLRRMARFAVAATGKGTIFDLFARQPREALVLPEARAVAVWWPDDAGPRPVGTALFAWHTFAGASELGILPVVGTMAEDLVTVPFDEVSDIEIADDGRLYAAVEPQGLVTLGRAPELVPWLIGLGRLAGPRRIAVGDEVVLGDRWPRVQRWTRAGVALATLPLYLVDAGTVRASDVAAAGPHRYALSSEGVVRLVGEDAVTGMWSSRLNGWAAPVAIAAHGEEVAVLDLARQQVDVLSSSLAEVDQWPVPRQAGEFKYVADVAVSAGQVFLANPETSVIEVLSRAGQAEGAIGVPNGIARVAAHPDGVVLALSESGWVFAFDVDGAPRGVWPVGEEGDRPTDIALDEAGRLYVTDAGDEIRVYERDDAAPVREPPETVTDRCQLVRDKTAQPPEIELGETVEVSLVVAGWCTAEDRSADVILAIDVSGSMGQRAKDVAAKNAAIAFVAQMDPDSTRVGVVAFSTNAQLVQGLTRDRGAVIGRIGALPIGGGTNLPEALDVALRALSGPPRKDTARVIVLLTDGRSTVEGVEQGSAAVRQAGIELFTIGLGSDADGVTLERIATDTSHYFFSPVIDELTSLFTEIGRRIWAPDALAEVDLVDRVPENMAYIHGSARPVEPQVSPDGRVLTWPQGSLSSAQGFRVTYLLQPWQAGRWPTNEEAYADYVDGVGHANRLTFPVPFVIVRAPLYVPLALRESCDPMPHPNAIVLVLDASKSMEDPVAGGGTKIDAAREAARVFLSLIDLTRDRVGIVSFNQTAELLQPLTGDHRALTDALERIRTAPGTSIVQGIDVAHRELTGPQRRPEDRSVIILLTDGRSNPEPPETAVARARTTRADGVTIFTIGLGSDTDAATLRAIADTPEQYFYSPDAAGLAEVYGRIARLVPCPPGRFWGGR